MFDRTLFLAQKTKNADMNKGNMHEKRLTNDFFDSEMKTKVIETCLVALVKSHNLNFISGLLHGQVHNIIS